MTTNLIISEETKNICSTHGLDFQIIKTPLTFSYDDQVLTSPYFGLINSKSGNCINTVKDGYTVTQTDEIVELVLQGMKGFGELSVQKAGSINDGRKTFIQLGIEGLATVGKDKVKQYVTIIDSNDGSSGLSVGIGDLTMSCQNQFFKFYKQGQAKFRHSNSIVQRIGEIPELIEFALNESMRQVVIYNTLANRTVSKMLADQMVKGLIGIERTENLEEVSTNKINQMNSLYNHIAKEMNDKGENAWGLHSGVTSWTTHDRTAPKRDNGIIESLMVGSAYNLNQRSLEFAMTL